MTRAWQNFRRRVDFQRERDYLLDSRGFLRSSAFFPHPPFATIKLRVEFTGKLKFSPTLLPDIADSNSLIAPLRWRSMILPPLRRVAKGQQWFESCMRFRATSSRVWMDFFPSFLRLIMARIRRVRKQLYASKVSVYACCWFLLLIRRSIVCCTG